MDDDDDKLVIEERRRPLEKEETPDEPAPKVGDYLYIHTI